MFNFSAMEISSATAYMRETQVLQDLAKVWSKWAQETLKSRL